MSSDPTARLVALGVDPKLARALVLVISGSEVIPGDVHRADGEGLMFPPGRWVIHDDEIGLLAALKDATLAGFGTSYAAQELADQTFVTGVAMLIFGVFKLVRQAVKKGARLEAIEFRVLASLKHIGKGVTSSELAVELSKGGGEWTGEQAEAELRKLSATSLRDGTVVALANEDAGGRWTVAGVIDTTDEGNKLDQRSALRGDGAMTDLSNTGRMFEVSTRLQSAADALERATAGGQLCEQHNNALHWAAEFLTSVGIEPSFSASGNLSVQATSARPTFFATLMRINSQLRREGVDSQEALAAFLKELLAVLQSGVVEDHASAAKLGIMLLHQLSNGFLNSVSRGVIHRPATMEK